VFAQLASIDPQLTARLSVCTLSLSLSAAHI